MARIDQSTLVPLGMVAAVVSCIGWGTFKAGAFYQRVTAEADSVRTHDADIAQIKVDVATVKTDVAAVKRAIEKFRQSDLTFDFKPAAPSVGPQPKKGS